MLSFSLQRALEREVVGQKRAVETVVRSLTVARGGLDYRLAPLGVFLFVGPSGTGKTHLARSLARILHGDTDRLAIADCSLVGASNDWTAISRQVAHHFRLSDEESEDPVHSMAPLSILLVEHLEQARPEFARAMIMGLEGGLIMLPDGERGSLAGCLVLVTSNLCGRQIFAADRREIGFSPADEELPEGEKARIYQLCVSTVEKRWGPDILAHLDDLIIFHRLREGHLAVILQRLLLELNHQLTGHGVVCDLSPTAEKFLVHRAAAFLSQGASCLAKIFRRFVLFPVSDILQSGDLPEGCRIEIDAETGTRLRFAVKPETRESGSLRESAESFEVTVA